MRFQTYRGFKVNLAHPVISIYFESAPFKLQILSHVSELDKFRSERGGWRWEKILKYAYEHRKLGK